jgi:hypothetical protein
MLAAAFCRYSTKETFVAYWGMGLYWGKASSNNKKGHMIGHIKDIGHDPSSPLTRLYATHAAQPFHNDSAGVWLISYPLFSWV